MIERGIFLARLFSGFGCVTLLFKDHRLNLPGRRLPKSLITFYSGAKSWREQKGATLWLISASDAHCWMPGIPVPPLPWHPLHPPGRALPSESPCLALLPASASDCCPHTNSPILLCTCQNLLLWSLQEHSPWLLELSRSVETPGSVLSWLGLCYDSNSEKLRAAEVSGDEREAPMMLVHHLL